MTGTVEVAVAIDDRCDDEADSSCGIWSDRLITIGVTVESDRLVKAVEVEAVVMSDVGCASGAESVNEEYRYSTLRHLMMLMMMWLLL